MAKKIGRPSAYSKKLADLICWRLANGESLRAICRDPDMPADSTVRLWDVEDREGFSAQYAKARAAQAQRWAEEILEIADDGSNDWMDRNDPNNEGYSFNGEHSSRSRLRVDTRKWLLSKVLPKVYGDKQSVTVNHRFDPSDMTDDELAEIIAAHEGTRTTAH